VRLDPRVVAVARRHRAQGLYAEAVSIRYILPHTGKLGITDERGKRREVKVHDRELIDALMDAIGDARPSPRAAVIWGASRVDALTGRISIWLPGGGDRVVPDPLSRAPGDPASRSRDPSRQAAVVTGAIPLPGLHDAASD